MMNQLHPLYRQDIDQVLESGLPFDALRGARIAVTGATGMVGACLTDVLIAASRKFDLNLQIYALCRNAERAKARFPDGALTVLSRDLTASPQPLSRMDYIVHAASNAHPLSFSSDPVGTMKANFLGTLHLLEHLRETGGKRLLFVSTGEIYGENPDVQDGFREDSFGKIDTMNPRACYPEGKRAAETLCASFVRQFDVDAVVARLCYVYGPTILETNSRADAQFLRNALAGNAIVLKSEGMQLRSYCYVTDAVSAMLTILLRGEKGAAYNVANRASTATIREYAETLAKHGGVQLRFDLPPEAERQGYSTVTKAVQNPERLEALGWRAQHALDDGLKRTIEILRQGKVS